MKTKIALVYTREHNESIVEKNRLKKENPNAVIIEASSSKNKKALKEILEDDNYKVISCHKSLNARVAKSEKARIKAREDKLREHIEDINFKAQEMRNSTGVLEVKDKSKKSASKKKAVEKKTTAKGKGKATSKKKAVEKKTTAKGKGKATSKK